jgi:hypothetical protein
MFAVFAGQPVFSILLDSLQLIEFVLAKALAPELINTKAKRARYDQTEQDRRHTFARQKGQFVAELIGDDPRCYRAKLSGFCIGYSVQGIENSIAGSMI